MTKKILFPTDFSETAQGALNFAALIAHTTGAEIVLAHVLQPELGAVNESGFVTDINVMMLENAEKSLAKLKAELEERGVSAATHVSQGFIADEINYLLSKEPMDMIIMGSHGTSGFLEKIVGSTAAYVMEKSPITSIIVPAGYETKVVERIAFAHQLESPDINYIEKAVDFAIELGVGTVDIVHVENEESLNVFNDKAVIKAIEEVFSEEKFKFHFYKSDSVAEGLERFIKDQQIDILATASNKKTFWDTLFGTHFSKKIAEKISVPVMVIK
jgi:nucleotide-binding universal stress UspA family protein